MTSSDSIGGSPLPKKPKRSDDNEGENQKFDVSDSKEDEKHKSDGYESEEDGYEDGLHEMTMEEAREYFKRVGDSDGFDVPDLPTTFALGMIIPYFKPGEEFTHVKSVEKLKSCSMLAIEDYNRRNGTSYKFVKVLKANSQPVAGYMLYITFEAKDADDHTETFEGKVFVGITETEVLISRRQQVCN